jgi:hypothetical protein
MNRIPTALVMFIIAVTYQVQAASVMPDPAYSKVNLWTSSTGKLRTILGFTGDMITDAGANKIRLDF